MNDLLVVFTTLRNPTFKGFLSPLLQMNSDKIKDFKEGDFYDFFHLPSGVLAILPDNVQKNILLDFFKSIRPEKYLRTFTYYHENGDTLKEQRRIFRETVDKNKYHYDTGHSDEGFVFDMLVKMGLEKNAKKRDHIFKEILNGSSSSSSQSVSWKTSSLENPKKQIREKLNLLHLCLEKELAIKIDLKKYKFLSSNEVYLIRQIQQMDNIFGNQHFDILTQLRNSFIDKLET